MFASSHAAVVRQGRKVASIGRAAAEAVFRSAGAARPAISSHIVIYKSFEKGKRCPFCSSDKECDSNIAENRKKEVPPLGGLLQLIDLSALSVHPEDIDKILEEVKPRLIRGQLLFLSFRKYPEYIYSIQEGGEIHRYKLDGDNTAVIETAFCCKADYETPTVNPFLLALSFSDDGRVNGYTPVFFPRAGERA